MHDEQDARCAVEGHDWQITEIVIEINAADTVSTCVRCGAAGYEAGQGRRPRPPLPEIRLTRPELGLDP